MTNINTNELAGTIQPALESTTPIPASASSPSGAGRGERGDRGARNAPTHAVFHVRDTNGTSSKGKKAFWTRIGSAWPHADGQGFNVQMECVPLDGRLSLRIIDEAKD